MQEPLTDRLFLAGRWEESSEQTAVQNPYTRETIGHVCQATLEHLENATAAATEAAAAFRWLPRHVKSRMCQDIADGIQRRSEGFAHLIVQESGKPLQFARGEVTRAVTTFTIAAREALNLTGELIPLDITQASEHLTGHTLRISLGPVAAISPFNFPLNLVAHKIAPAIAVGCPVVLKPAPQTPLTALLLARVIEEAAIPPGIISVLPMSVETAELMVKDERYKVLSFTGSAAVGWHLKSIAGRKRVLLELGGNAPAIVHADADLNQAVNRLVPGSFAAAGQVCIKAQRIYVHESIHDVFMDKFITAAGQLPCGSPDDEKTVVGPVIDQKSADRIRGWIDEAVKAGADVLLADKGDGTLITPVVLSNVPRNTKCYREEIFGPVVLIEKYRDIAEAIENANHTEYGLQAAVFTFDTRIIHLATRELEYGGIIINDSSMVRVDNFPYGGTKASGFGREGIRYAMEEFTELRMIVERNDFQ